jgi:hypothetical protein
MICVKTYSSMVNLKLDEAYLLPRFLDDKN